jgi:hypothetical protein
MDPAVQHVRTAGFFMRFRAQALQYRISLEELSKAGLFPAYFV